MLAVSAIANAKNVVVSLKLQSRTTFLSSTDFLLDLSELRVQGRDTQRKCLQQLAPEMEVK